MPRNDVKGSFEISMKLWQKIAIGYSFGAFLISMAIWFSIVMRVGNAKKLTTILINDIPLKVEISDTPKSREKGLMYRRKLPEDQGMLFVFEWPGIHPFWMKNTYIPLSIAFVSQRREIVQIQDMEPLDTLNLHIPKKPVLYAIEVNKGWFTSHNVKVGDTVYIDER